VIESGWRARARRVVAIASAALCAGACAASAGDAAPELAADPMLAEMGEPLYARSCAACHGADGTGDGPVALSLRVPPADLTRIAARRGGEFPAGEIARFVDGRFDVPAHGTREMPVWGDELANDVPESGLAEEIKRGKIAALVEYLKTIQVEP
jgi:mono/diheme cytochrome c family protein